MFMLNGKTLPLDTPFEADGIQYPANWLRLTTLAEKVAIGITEVEDPVPYDDRFYWGPDMPKDFEMVKATLLMQIKTTAYAMLAPTDYKVVRKVETGEDVDAETTAMRTAIRQAHNDNAALINAATTVAELAALQFNWPELAA
jgi:hypothetical protein